MEENKHEPIMETIIRTAWDVWQRDVDQVRSPVRREDYPDTLRGYCMWEACTYSRGYLLREEYTASARICELLGQLRTRENDQELTKILEERKGHPMRLGFGAAAHHGYFAYVARMQSACEYVHDFVIQYLGGKTFEPNQLKERLEELKTRQSREWQDEQDEKKWQEWQNKDQ